MLILRSMKLVYVKIRKNTFFFFKDVLCIHEIISEEIIDVIIEDQSPADVIRAEMRWIPVFWYKYSYLVLFFSKKIKEYSELLENGI